MNKLSATSLKRLEDINIVLLHLIDEALKYSPIDFGIPEHGGKRNEAEQLELFTKGVSKCDGIKIESKHQSGNAFDIYAYINSAASWDDVHLSIIAGAILATARRMNIRIRWGGTFGSDDFNGWDKGHFELI
jgi:hypothetical protein